MNLFRPALLAASLIASTLPSAAQMPKLEWYKELHGSDKISITDIQADRRGNFFVHGIYTGTIDLDPGPGVTALQERDGSAFFAKYDGRGNLVWARAMPMDIAQWTTDHTGRIWYVSPVSGTVDFDPGPGLFELTANGTYCIGALGFGGDFSCAFDTKIAAGIAVRSVVATVGNVYIAGAFSGSFDADPGKAVRTLSSNGSSDAFVVKYSNKGLVQDAFSFGGTGADAATSIAVSPTSLYVGGIFSGTVNFDRGQGSTMVSSTGSAGFLAEYESIRNTINVHVLGQRVTQLSCNAENGDLLVSGVIGDSLDADPGRGRSMLYSVKPADFYAITIANTGALRYARAIRNGSRTAPGVLSGTSKGGMFIAGACSGALDFNGGATGGMIDGYGLQDGYVSKYDGDGTHRYAFCIGSADASTTGCVTINPGGTIFLAGASTGGVDLDPGPGTATTSGAGAFLARFSDNETLQVPLQSGDAAVEIYNSGRNVYFDFSACRSVDATIGITDINGRTILKTTHNHSDMRRLDLGQVAPGMYIATVTDGPHRVSRKIVVQ